MKTWKTIDKSKWGQGEWRNEPDKAQWIDERTGLDCLIVRGPSGALCGYVGLPESHKHFGSDYYDPDVDIHGGLTFADFCSPGEDESVGICHSGEIANKKVWWFGFDCAHLYDATPAHRDTYTSGNDTYRTFEYVKTQTGDLARQLEQLK